MAKTKTSRYDVAEHLRPPEEMAAYLEACLEEAWRSHPNIDVFQKATICCIMLFCMVSLFKKCKER